MSSVNHRRTVRSCTPNTGAVRTVVLRGRGTASALIDKPSSRWSCRIRSNCSTLDLSFNPYPSIIALADVTDSKG